MEKNSYKFWKINKFIKKKNSLPDDLLGNYFFRQSINNFSALLLWKMCFWYL